MSNVRFIRFNIDIYENYFLCFTDDNIEYFLTYQKHRFILSRVNSAYHKLYIYGICNKK